MHTHGAVAGESTKNRVVRHLGAQMHGENYVMTTLS